MAILWKGKGNGGLVRKEDVERRRIETSSGAKELWVVKHEASVDLIARYVEGLVTLEALRELFHRGYILEVKERTHLQERFLEEGLIGVVSLSSYIVSPEGLILQLRSMARGRPQLLWQEALAKALGRGWREKVRKRLREVER